MESKSSNTTEDWVVSEPPREHPQMGPLRKQPVTGTILIVFTNTIFSTIFLMYTFVKRKSALFLVEANQLIAIFCLFRFSTNAYVFHKFMV